MKNGTLRIINHPGGTLLQYWVELDGCAELYKSMESEEIPNYPKDFPIDGSPVRKKAAWDIMYFLVNVCERYPGEAFEIVFVESACLPKVDAV